jgi:alkaline phosphatase
MLMNRSLFRFLALSCLALAVRAADTGSAIFYNIDGADTAIWTATRWLTVGPDGELNWDRLPATADLRTHVKGILTSGSAPSCTAQAFGIKVGFASFGTDRGKPITALSGKPMSIMEEAQQAGKAVGIVSDANILAPGTGVFYGKISPEQMLPIDKTSSGWMTVAEQMLEAKPDLILGGGESFFVLAGSNGRHGKGRRTDGKDLIARAKELGYHVVFTRDELKQTPLSAKRVLGLFAAGDHFKASSEEDLRDGKVIKAVSTAPTITEMTEFALSYLEKKPKGFFLALNGEIADNYSGVLNARDTMLALAEDDKNLGVILRHMERAPKTHLLVLGDGPSAGFTPLGAFFPGQRFPKDTPLPATDPTTGAPVDGREGTATPPFIAAPDRFGERLTFAVSWSTRADHAGGILMRGAGYRADLIRGSMDNTDVYRVLYEVLLGKRLPAAAGAGQMVPDGMRK